MKYWKLFSIFFFLNLIIDIIFNTIDGLYNFRFMTKPLVIISLLLYYYFNSKDKVQKERVSIMLALIFLLLGDIFLMTGFSFYNFWAGSTFFLLANIAYASAFYRSAHFDIDRSIPFVAIVSLICLTLLYFIYEKLDSFFFPATVYMFITLNMSQAAYLRNRVVNNKSYYAIFLGSLFFLASQASVAIIKFYGDFPFQTIIVMLFYGLSQYLIVYGILIEKKKFRRF